MKFKIVPNLEEESWDLIEVDGIKSEEGNEDAVVAKLYDPKALVKFLGTFIEDLADLEHQQWVHWSKAVADEVSPERRKRWEQYWVPYKELPEDVKEADRIWARRVLEVFCSAYSD